MCRIFNIILTLTIFQNILIIINIYLGQAAETGSFFSFFNFFSSSFPRVFFTAACCSFFHFFSFFFWFLMKRSFVRMRPFVCSSVCLGGHVCVYRRARTRVPVGYYRYGLAASTDAVNPLMPPAASFPASSNSTSSSYNRVCTIIYGVSCISSSNSSSSSSNSAS